MKIRVNNERKQLETWTEGVLRNNPDGGSIKKQSYVASISWHPQKIQLLSQLRVTKGKLKSLNKG